MASCLLIRTRRVRLSACKYTSSRSMTSDRRSAASGNETPASSNVPEEALVLPGFRGGLPLEPDVLLGVSSAGDESLRRLIWPTPSKPYSSASPDAYACRTAYSCKAPGSRGFSIAISATSHFGLINPRLPSVKRDVPTRLLTRTARTFAACSNACITFRDFFYFLILSDAAEIIFACESSKACSFPHAEHSNRMGIQITP